MKTKNQFDKERLYATDDIFVSDGIKRKKQKERIFLEGKIKKKISKDVIIAWSILTPMLIWWLVVSGFPMLVGFVLGFFEWRNVNAVPKFVGIDNFIAFFKDETYLGDLGRTIVFGFGITLVTMLTSFACAFLLNRNIKLKGFLRSIWYIPAVTSPVAISHVMSLLFDPFKGVINRLLEGAEQEPIILATNIGWSIALIFIYSIWKGCGSGALIWLAGLQSIDPDLYEAAEIDGANKFHRFWSITLPGLKPISLYVFITGIISAFQIYEPIAFITNGGPYGATNVLALRIIQDGYQNFNFGMAGASGLLLAVLIMACSAFTYKAMTKDRGSL